jgi:hypothetical protein
MGRTQGSKNKDQLVRPVTSELSIDERMHLLSSIIVDTIVLEQQNDYPLLQKLKHENSLCLE